MKIITNRTQFTPGLAHYCEAVQAGNVMTVDYYTSAKTPIVPQLVNLQARLMEAAAYEKMIKAPAAPKADAEPAENPNCKTIDGGKQTDKKYGKDLSKGEEEAIDMAQDAIKDADDDLEQEAPELTKGISRASEPRPNQRLTENLRQAELDDLYTVKQIQEAMLAVEAFDDEGARDEFIGALGEPVGNDRDLQKPREEGKLDESVRIMDRFLKA